MELSHQLAHMDAEDLRDLTATLLGQLAQREAQLTERDAELSARTAQIASRDEELKRTAEDRSADARDGDLEALALWSAQRAAQCRAALPPG